MYPIIFNYKFITIGGFGVMLALASYLIFLIFERELKLKGIDPELAYKIIIVIIPLGILGSKTFHILDYFDDFLRDPIGMIFSGSGLSVLGGFIFASIGGALVVKKNKQNFLEITDAIAPALAVGYGIGRIGCHVAGDGCYGLTTSSFLGVAYPNGIVPTSLPVFPTPLMESFFSLLLFAVLLQIRKINFANGTIFFIYTLISSISRFLIEFIRRNPKIFYNLSQAQVVSLIIILISLISLGLIQANQKKFTTP